MKALLANSRSVMSGVVHQDTQPRVDILIKLEPHVAGLIGMST